MTEELLAARLLAGEIDATRRRLAERHQAAVERGDMLEAAATAHASMQLALLKSHMADRALASTGAG